MGENAQEHYAQTGERSLSALYNSTKVTVAAIDGWCIGGGISVAVSCDLRYCSEKSKFGQPAMRYGIGIGRDGFTWSGVQTITRKAEWPAWTPPPEMIARQPYLPRHMAGGPGNPLGARAMYLGGTIYRIHGTNAPETIGTRVSSGCLRLTNEDVSDLYSRVSVGTKVIVLPMTDRRADLGRTIR